MTQPRTHPGRRLAILRLLDRWGADSVTVLCFFVAALLAIPSFISVRVLGSVGVVGVLLGLAAFYWWGWHHIQRTTVHRHGTQPVRWSVCLLLVAAVVSFGYAMFLPRPADEISTAESALLRLFALAGVTLVAHDGIRSVERLRVLVRALTIGAALVAALSIVQFFTGEVWLDRIPWPSFLDMPPLGFGERQGLTRPTGTATHPIELASLLTMVLPLALVGVGSGGRVKVTQMLVIGSIFVASMISLSRTAIIGLVIGLAFALPSLPRRWRAVTMGAAAAMTGLLYVTVPGLIGTLRGLFMGIDSDPSIQSRTDSLGLVAEFFARSPWVGRGLGTFLPRYRILDNMYLQLLIEVGLLGIAALLAVLGSSIVTGWIASRRLPRAEDRAMAMGIVAGIASGTASLAFFDAFAFPQSCFTLFLLVGMAGSLWRLGVQPEPHSGVPAHRTVGD